METSSRMVHQNIKENAKSTNWPPTPQEIIENTDHCNSATFNSIAWIINPDANLGDNGLVKVSKNKEFKISKICQDIESLMPNSVPSFDQLLLSLIFHRKTASIDIIDTLHYFGHGVPYTDLRFVGDKWAEWDEEQNSIIPSNIVKGVPTIHVTDNIDWKNKNLGGRETHNTNSILIHEECSTSAKVKLNPNYNFVRKDHRAYKSRPSNIPDFRYSKSESPKFLFDYRKDIIQAMQQITLSSERTLLWLVYRLMKNKDEIIKVPSWNGFNYLT